MRLGLLAGEASGDILGASVVRALCQRHQTLDLAGMGGPLLEAQHLESLYPMDRLSVFGLVEPLKRLPELLKIRRDVFTQQRAFQPDVFLGIDSPDFNLALEAKLRATGIATAHLVSPSVWAWRAGRINQIAKAVDLMLCLLPFELDIYREAGVPAVCVGHPLIEELGLLPSQATARARLGLTTDDRSSAGPLIAVLPGSRAGEVAHLMPIFANTMALLAASDPTIRFVIPAANAARRAQIDAILSSYKLPVTVVDGEGRMAMVAADHILLASGTATLEAMLLRKPMVIAYRMAWFSWQLLSRMATTAFVGLPNVLAGREVVPELLQDSANPESLHRAMMSVIEYGADVQVPAFDALAAMIGGDFANRCADALDGLVAARR
jgi:lipid-A-disaccharide synthase